MAERDNFVPIKFPLFLGEAREREVNGKLAMVQPFVELRRIFDIQNQAYAFPKSKFSKQVYLGLKLDGAKDIFGAGDPNEPDPIRLYRALQILNRLDTFPITRDQNTPLVANLYRDIRDTYGAAGRNFPLSHHRYVRDRIRAVMGEESFQKVLQMIPLNLMEVTENLHKLKVKINGETLKREINRERIETNPLYEEVITETRKRRERERKSTERYLWSL